MGIRQMTIGMPEGEVDAEKADALADVGVALKKSLSAVQGVDTDFVCMMLRDEGNGYRISFMSSVDMANTKRVLRSALNALDPPYGESGKKLNADEARRGFNHIIDLIMESIRDKRDPDEIRALLEHMRTLVMSLGRLGTSLTETLRKVYNDPQLQAHGSEYIKTLVEAGIEQATADLAKAKP